MVVTSWVHKSMDVLRTPCLGLAESDPSGLQTGFFDFGSGAGRYPFWFWAGNGIVISCACWLPTAGLRIVGGVSTSRPRGNHG